MNIINRGAADKMRVPFFADFTGFKLKYRRPVRSVPDIEQQARRVYAHTYLPKCMELLKLVEHFCPDNPLLPFACNLVATLSASTTTNIPVIVPLARLPLELAFCAPRKGPMIPLSVAAFSHPQTQPLVA